MSLLSKLTGREHHFKVLLTYRPDKGQERPSVQRRVNIWMQDRSFIADDREIKKAVAESMLAQIPRHLKRNGALEVTEVYYLGWFKPVKPKKKKRLADYLGEAWVERLMLEYSKPEVRKP